jgi:hypothetical protein
MNTLLTCAARVADHSSVLHAIREEDCNLAIWQRPLLADFAPLIEGTPQDLRFTAALADLPAIMRAGLASGGYGGTALHAALVEDASLLARLFCDAMGLAALELRLEVVRSDSCRKFHADYVPARLITTYVGEGTDWLDEADADRVAAGREPQRIKRMNTGDVGLFKGKLATPRPAIHRSPPIAGTGAARLLLVMDPAAQHIGDSAVLPCSPGPEVA